MRKQVIVLAFAAACGGDATVEEANGGAGGSGGQRAAAGRTAGHDGQAGYTGGTAGQEIDAAAPPRPVDAGRDATTDAGTSAKQDAAPLVACSADAIKTTAALIAAIAERPDGADVALGAVTFELSAALQPKPGMKLHGCGAGRTIVRGAPGWMPDTSMLPNTDDPSAYLFRIVGKDGVAITDLTLTGPKLHGAVYASGSKDLELGRLRVEDFRWSGVRTRNVTRARVHDNEFVDAGGRFGNTTGGCLYDHWPRQSEFWNNRMSQKPGATGDLYGFKGYGGEANRFHHNDVRVRGFSMEYPHDHFSGFEVDHNYFQSTISVPKQSGGSKLAAYAFALDVHHNVLRNSYAFEFPRNDTRIHHNVMLFTNDGGHMITDFSPAASPGPVDIHDNLIKDPGRGIYAATDGAAFGGFSFHNNEIEATTTTRTEALFKPAAGNDFTTFVLRDNVIRCPAAAPRPLVTTPGRAAVIENNTLENVSDSGAYGNKPADRPRGLTAPLQFPVGVDGEITVDGWVVRGL